MEFWRGTLEDLVVRPAPAFWQGRNVLITGHTGFKGTWLSFWLKQLGASVTGLSLPLSKQNVFFEGLGLKEEINHISSDINDYESLKKHVSQISPDIIFHFAAQSLVFLGYQNPLNTWQTNVLGSANILKAVEDAKKEKCLGVMATTDKVYKNSETGIPFCEGDPLGGYDPYSASKAANEFLISSWCKAFQDVWGSRGNVVNSVRAGNVIGGGDWSERRIIPDLARAFADGVPLVVRSPASVRPWQYILDVLNGYICLAQKTYGNSDFHGSAWNIGPDITDVHRVQDIIDIATKLWNGATEILDQSEFIEANQLVLDSSKIRKKIGWKPAYSFNLAVERTIGWYKKATDGQEVRQLCLEELEYFNSGGVNEK